MRLSIEHRRVVITIYLKNNLHLRTKTANRQLALEVDIEASDYSGLAFDYSVQAFDYSVQAFDYSVQAADYSGLAFDYSELAARCSMAE
jgi:hypothetical protein